MTVFKRKWYYLNINICEKVEGCNDFRFTSLHGWKYGTNFQLDIHRIPCQITTKCGDFIYTPQPPQSPHIVVISLRKMDNFGFLIKSNSHQIQANLGQLMKNFIFLLGLLGGKGYFFTPFYQNNHQIWTLQLMSISKIYNMSTFPLVTQASLSMTR